MDIIEGQVFITLKYGIFINYPSHSKIARLGKLAYFRGLYRLNDMIKFIVFCGRSVYTTNRKALVTF